MGRSFQELLPAVGDAMSEQLSAASSFQICLSWEEPSHCRSHLFCVHASGDKVRLANGLFSLQSSLPVGPVCVYVCVCVHVHVCASAQLCLIFATPWTEAYQAPLSMRFPRQEYWSRLPVGPGLCQTRTTIPLLPLLSNGFFSFPLQG